MTWLSWCIAIIPVVVIIAMGLYARKYVRGVADFLAAGRVAGRDVISVGDLEAGLGVITLVALSPWPAEWWSRYFLVTSLVVSAVVGVISTVWLMIGGAIDMRRLFRDLKARTDNPLDDGWVKDHVSAADLALVQAVEKGTGAAPAGPGEAPKAG